MLDLLGEDRKRLWERPPSSEPSWGLGCVERKEGDPRGKIRQNIDQNKHTHTQTTYKGLIKKKKADEHRGAGPQRGESLQKRAGSEGSTAPSVIRRRHSALTSPSPPKQHPDAIGRRTLCPPWGSRLVHAADRRGESGVDTEKLILTPGPRGARGEGRNGSSQPLPEPPRRGGGVGGEQEKGCATALGSANRSGRRAHAQNVAAGCAAAR